MHIVSYSIYKVFNLNHNFIKIINYKLILGGKFILNLLRNDSKSKNNLMQ